MTEVSDVRELAADLRFPEGPIALADGSVLLVEIARRTLTRVGADGEVQVVADCGGGPNGAALGPDGRVYVANNGGSFTYVDAGGMLIPVHRPQDTWDGGSIQRVDPDSGEVETLFTHGDGHQLRAPNDLVFDDHGGFWFTDFGIRDERSIDVGSLFYARADGSEIHEVVHGLDCPNGVGLSPDGSRLYAVETYRGRAWTWNVTGPGEVAAENPAVEHGGTLLRGFADLRYFDSLAVDGEGWVCVATILEGGITAISPDGQQVEHTPLPDAVVTNICFGGDDLRTAYVTLSGTGKLAAIDWPRPGLALPHAL